MLYELKKLNVNGAEKDLVYSHSNGYIRSKCSPFDMQTGCIGHLRFYWSGDIMYHDFFPHFDGDNPRDWKAFSGDLQETMDIFTYPSGILSSRNALHRYLLNNSNHIAESESAYRYDTRNYSFCFRFHEYNGNYNYVYCYRRDTLNRYLGEVTREMVERELKSCAEDMDFLEWNRLDLYSHLCGSTERHKMLTAALEMGDKICFFSDTPVKYDEHECFSYDDVVKAIQSHLENPDISFEHWLNSLVLVRE